jgi:hypothetical protein
MRLETVRGSPLFKTKRPRHFFAMHYDVTGDGQRFLLNVDESSEGNSIAVFLNWTKGLSH